MYNHEEVAKRIEALYHQGHYQDDLDKITAILRESYPAPTPSIEAMELIDMIRDNTPKEIGWSFDITDISAASLLQSWADARAREIVEKLGPWLEHDFECEQRVVGGTKTPCTCGLDSILAGIGGK